MGRAAGAVWSLAVGLLGSLIVLLPFGWPPWLAALVGFLVALAVAITLTVLDRRRKPPASPISLSTAIDLTGSEDALIEDSLFEGFDRPIHAPDSKNLRSLRNRMFRQGKPPDK